MVIITSDEYAELLRDSIKMGMFLKAAKAYYAKHGYVPNSMIEMIFGIELKKEDA